MLITQGRAIWSRNAQQKVALCWVLIKDPEGKLDPVLLGCTEGELAAVDIVSYFVRRWRVEVTFAEVRRHLGVETQRQWSALAIERSTPLLMGLMSIVCLLAVPLYQQQKITLESTAWYRKSGYTFSSVLGAVRQQVWDASKLSTSMQNGEVNSLQAKVRYLQQLLTQAVA